MKEITHNSNGFEKVTWNYSEAGHGKGAPYGVGGVMKRTADKIVSYGNDIADANEFFQAIKKADIAVDLHMITDDSVLNIDKA